ncbi:MAG: mechanosensitive ion channel family protein [Gammaproteobacteria bacterium]|jgi:miniconductance mechanosensitive channel|nr:mechanosensitive ion channel family protein [Gammaproteobacteria bacterium]
MFEQLETFHPWLPAAAGIGVLVLLALLVQVLAKRVLLAGVQLVVERTRATWDDMLVDHKVFVYLARILPAMVIAIGIGLIPGLADRAVRLVHNVVTAYVVVMLMLALNAALSTANQFYETLPVSRSRPLKGFVQLLQIAVYVLGTVLVIAALLDRSPALLLTGFGAMTAILMLVFKDTILSLVASVQISGQDLVQVGDWIEMPQFGADGDVVDVQLHTVKVQNWDKTITTIPTHRLISDSFKNWRGMSESGGRRIKRAIHIDTSTIRFLSPEEEERFADFELLQAYMREKLREIREQNAGVEGDAGASARRLTNVGTFRAYAFNYLKHSPHIHRGMTLLVRQLSPGAEGLPIEIYCFTNTTEWKLYEDIQADIFDHFLAIIPSFGLKVFQLPSGSDVAGALDRAAGG